MSVPILIAAIIYLIGGGVSMGWPSFWQWIGVPALAFVAGFAIERWIRR